MTTRFKEEDLTEGLTGAIHETGMFRRLDGQPAFSQHARRQVAVK